MLMAAAVQADATLVVRGSDGIKSPIQLRNGKGRMSADGLDEYIVYDAGGQLITYVDPAGGRYTQVSEGELEANLQTAVSVQNSISPYMENMLAGLPPAQRRMLEQRMGGLLRPPAAGTAAKADMRTVARGTHMFAGLRCKASDIVKNGRTTAKVCMATDASGRLSPQDFSTLEAIVSFLREVAPGAQLMPGALADQLQFLAAEVDGVPVAVRDLEHSREYQVISVSNAALSDALFNAYGKYEKRAMAELLP